MEAAAYEGLKAENYLGYLRTSQQNGSRVEESAKTRFAMEVGIQILQSSTAVPKSLGVRNNHWETMDRFNHRRAMTPGRSLRHPNTDFKKDGPYLFFLAG